MRFRFFVRLIVGSAFGLFIVLIIRYWQILGGAAKAQGSPGRAKYEAFLERLELGGTPAKVYRKWLTWGLDRVDAFFGDSDHDDKSRFARAFGLETPGARWTAPAFDRCLLLALLYPVITIIAVWAWSGHVGVGERALRLWETPPSDPRGAYWRAAYGVSLIVSAYGWTRFSKAVGVTNNVLWLVVMFGGAALALALALAFGGAGSASAGIVAVSLAIVGAGAGAVTFAAAVAFPFAVAGAIAVAAAFAGALVVAFAFIVAVAFAVALAVATLSDWSRRNARQGAFLWLLLLSMSGLAFAGAWLFSPYPTWPFAGAILLVFGVLTLVNAPFDWFAIGLTRALLRRGLAPGGRGPFFYALVDAILAPPVITLLAFVTILAVQSFDDIAVLRAGSNARILPLGPLFEGLGTHVRRPEKLTP